MTELIKAGDRVRITIEGIADEILSGQAYGEHPEPRHFDTASSRGDMVTIEKIEPPVVTFGPGDVVRKREWSTHPGYLILADGQHASLENGAIHEECSFKGPFTSEDYERVNFDSPA